MYDEVKSIRELPDAFMIAINRSRYIMITKEQVGESNIEGLRAYFSNGLETRFK